MNEPEPIVCPIRLPNGETLLVRAGADRDEANVTRVREALEKASHPLETAAEMIVALAEDLAWNHRRADEAVQILHELRDGTPRPARVQEFLAQGV